MDHLLTKFKNFINNLLTKNNQKNLSFENLHQIAFCLFILSIPLQTRLTLLTNYTSVTNEFIEYNAKFLYLSDIILIITFILYLVNLLARCNNRFVKQNQQVIHSFTPRTSDFHSTLSNLIRQINFYFKTLLYYFVNVSRETISKRSQIIKNPVSILIIFIIWTSLSVFWSNYKEISFYRNLKLIEFAFLSIYVANNFYSVKKIVKSLLLIVIAGNIQFIIAISQFITQKSLGLKILGESFLNSSVLGVAKISLFSEKIIRPYGTFPHPNILAGFVIVTIIAAILLIIYNKSYSENSKKLLNLQNIPTILYKDFLHSRILSNLLFLSFILSNIVLILTFSRSAWFAMIISYLIIYLWTKNDYILWSSLIVKKLSKIMPFLAIFILIILPFIAIRLYKIDANNTITDRIFYNNIALSIISTHPLVGIGIGSSVPNIQLFSPINLSYWQYQPAHNIYLLIFSEIGLFGIIIFIYFIHSIFYYNQRKKVITSAFYRILYKMFHVKQFNNSSIKPLKNSSFASTGLLLFKLALFSFLLISLFDHYFWTIQQGQIIFWLIIGYILAINQIIAKNNISDKKNFIN